MAGNDGAASLQVCALRAARLAADGTTPAGANNMVVTNIFASLDANPVYQDGVEITVPNGCGGISYTYKEPPRLKWLDLTLTLNSQDPELQELLSWGSLITQGGSSTGFALPAVIGNPSAGVSLEAWTKAWVGGGPPPGATFTDAATTTASPTVTSATAAFTSADVGRTISGTGIPAGTTITAVTNATTITMSANATATAAGVTITIGRPGAYHRWAIPKAIFWPVDRNLANAGMQPQFKGLGFENPMWGNGPNNDWPTGAVTGRALAHIRDAALPGTIQPGYQATPVQV